MCHRWSPTNSHKPKLFPVWLNISSYPMHSQGRSFSSFHTEEKRMWMSDNTVNTWRRHLHESVQSFSKNQSECGLVEDLKRILINAFFMSFQGLSHSYDQVIPLPGEYGWLEAWERASTSEQAQNKYLPWSEWWWIECRQNRQWGKSLIMIKNVALVTIVFVWTNRTSAVSLQSKP